MFEIGRAGAFAIGDVRSGSVNAHRRWVTARSPFSLWRKSSWTGYTLTGRAPNDSVNVF